MVAAVLFTLAVLATPLRSSMLLIAVALGLGLLGMELWLLRCQRTPLRLVLSDGYSSLQWTASEAPQAVTLETRVLLPWLIVLDWHRDDARGSMPIWPDSLHPDDWRRLRARCR